MSAQSPEPGRIRPVVLWDLGGVVVDVDIDRGRQRWVSFGAQAASFDSAFFASGVKDRLDDGRMSRDEGLAEVARLAGPPMTEEYACAAFEAILSPRPEVSALVHRVAERARCYVISNTDPIHGPWIEANAGIASVIQDWIYSYDEHSMKPEPGLFQAALRRAGISAKDAVLIDDRLDNCATATALGIDAIPYTSFAEVESALRARGLA